jgi:DNA-binding NarL/FixJ family response regulator
VVASIAQDMQIKVAIVDDDEGIRTGLAALIRRAPNLKLAGDYANAETALKEIPRHPPDVVLMDINLPGMKGVECVRQLKAAMPVVQFLMLTVYEDSDSLFNSLKAGASGYLLKRTA